MEKKVSIDRWTRRNFIFFGFTNSFAILVENAHWHEQKFVDSHFIIDWTWSHVKMSHAINRKMKTKHCERRPLVGVCMSADVLRESSKTVSSNDRKNEKRKPIHFVIFRFVVNSFARSDIARRWRCSYHRHIRHSMDWPFSASFQVSIENNVQFSWHILTELCFTWNRSDKVHFQWSFAEECHPRQSMNDERRTTTDIR